MRERLSRGKRTDNDEGEFVYGIPVEGEVVDGVGKETYIITNPGLQWVDGVYMTYDECIEVDPETVGDYTGLTDKNGREIFEGDILQCENEYGSYTTSIYCEENTLCVDVSWLDNFDYTSIGFAESIWKKQNYEVEIIGNIYDNPELLEVKQNEV